MITIRPRFALDESFGTAYTASTLEEIWGRVRQKAGGGGWNWYVSGPESELLALGAVETESGWILDLGKTYIAVHLEESTGEPTLIYRTWMHHLIAAEVKAIWNNQSTHAEAYVREHGGAVVMYSTPVSSDYAKTWHFMDAGAAETFAARETRALRRECLPGDDPNLGSPAAAAYRVVA